MPSTPSGKPWPQEPPGTKSFHLCAGWDWEVFWHWHLSISAGLHGRWLCAPHIQNNWTSLWPRVPKSQLLLTGVWQRGSGHSQCHTSGVWWSLVLSKDEGTDTGNPLREAGGICAFTASLKHSFCAWGFSSSFSIWVPVPSSNGEVPIYMKC